MKTPIILSIAIVLFFASCEKVVLIDLNSKNPLPVVQAEITNEAGPYTVKLNSTVNYYESNTFPVITGANVSISDNSGYIENLTESAPGIYKTASIVGTAGKTYTLNITTSGKQFAAVSTMPNSAAIDSILFQLSGNGGGHGGGSDTTYRVICKFKDTPGVANYYMLELTSNDTAAFNQNNTRVMSDKLVDGEELSMTYRTHFHLNDSVTVKLKSIDKPIYDFYSTLQNATGNNNFLSSLPANPLNNISNGGLGYFSAYSVSKMSAVVH